MDSKTQRGARTIINFQKGKLSNATSTFPSRLPNNSQTQTPIRTTHLDSSYTAFQRRQGLQTLPPPTPFLTLINMASTTPSNQISTTAIILASAGVLATGALAYAVYFDHRRRSDPNFRRELKRQHKKINRQAEESSRAAESAQKERIKTLVAQANEEGFEYTRPTTVITRVRMMGREPHRWLP